MRFALGYPLGDKFLNLCSYSVYVMPRFACLVLSFVRVVKMLLHVFESVFPFNNKNAVNHGDY